MWKKHFLLGLILATLFGSCSDESDPVIRFIDLKGNLILSDTLRVEVDSTTTDPVQFLEVHVLDDKDISRIVASKEVNEGASQKMTLGELTLTFDNFGNGAAKYAAFITTNEEAGIKAEIPKYTNGDHIKILIEAEDEAGNLTVAALLIKLEQK